MMIEFIKPDFEFADDCGRLIQLVHQGWNQVNYITSVAGAFRGGHYHLENREAFYVVSGGFKLTLKHNQTRKTTEYDMKAGDFFIIYPNVTHSFDFTEETALISLYDNGAELPDGTKDILRSASTKSLP